MFIGLIFFASLASLRLGRVLLIVGSFWPARGASMTLRSGSYVVPTDRWYIERTVWLIAGAVLVAATALAALVSPWWALLIIATGISSVIVASTGFCIVGNILSRFGWSPALGARSANAKWYRMQTDRWYLERRIYLAVGINISIASVLSIAYSPWWLAVTAFVGVAVIWFAATGFCIMANGLYWLGAEPRLAPPPDGRSAEPIVSRATAPLTH